MTEDMPHVLVVDDDARLRSLLQRYLGENGFRVTVAADAAEARRQLAAMAFDLVVLDVTMPGESGFELTEDLRRGSDVPILLLTARGAPEDRIEGFERGADDYLATPFDPRELVLRLRAMLRRSQPAGGAPATVPLGEAVFDPARGELRRGEQAQRLTSGESALLAALARRPGEPMSREALAAAVGLAPEAGARAIDVAVVRLRRKIEPDPRNPRFLHTVRGRGYVLWPGAGMAGG